MLVNHDPKSSEKPFLSKSKGYNLKWVDTAQTGVRVRSQETDFTGMGSCDDTIWFGLGDVHTEKD